MKTDSLNSKTDGNGTYRTASPIANPNLSGPDVLGTSNNRMQQQVNTALYTPYTPAVKVTKATQQALDYYNKMSNCNCGK